MSAAYGNEAKTQIFLFDIKKSNCNTLKLQYLNTLRREVGQSTNGHFINKETK